MRRSFGGKWSVASDEPKCNLFTRPLSMNFWSGRPDLNWGPLGPELNAVSRLGDAGHSCKWRQRRINKGAE
jgi:hypothetical protein